MTCANLLQSLVDTVARQVMLLKPDAIQRRRKLSRSRRLLRKVAMAALTMLTLVLRTLAAVPTGIRAATTLVAAVVQTGRHLLLLSLLEDGKTTPRHQGARASDRTKVHGSTKRDVNGG